ncbi:Crp/Fnr family transcriptional regulator [Tunturiibacter lichenicola]|uniref:Crp/Fnr family transcriptional regulator n=1 Tax=Tunturiibacter lichenicola TaxID=2051959 RepID=UPI0021B15AAC|nr:Crp/Fnr family transcriptional regulator [Edaphobacter lichenicola]
MSPETSNLFLSYISPASRQSLINTAKLVDLPHKTKLYNADTNPQYAYFLNSGLASVVTPMANGGSAEVGFIGHEGVVGSLHLLGNTKMPTRCMVQLAGRGLRIALADLQKAFCDSEEVRSGVLQFVQSHAATTAQIAGCNRLHDAEQRLARWLLMAWDRTQENDLNFTQGYLAEMIAVERTTVTAIAGDMQRKGLIAYSRGQLKILNRGKLELTACECYPIVKKLFNGLYTC